MFQAQWLIISLGIDEAAWTAFLAKYPGKRFEIGGIIR
jgi:hypothetical protein